MPTFFAQWLLFVSLNFLAGLNAALWGFRCPSSRVGLIDFIANWLTLFAGQIVLVQTALGAFGFLGTWNMLLLLGGLSLVSFLWPGTQRQHLQIPPRWCAEAKAAVLFVRKQKTARAILVIIVWAGLGLGLAALATTTTFWDAFSYHLPAPVDWIQTGRLDIGYIPWTEVANSYFPGNGELLYLWVMAPFSNDLLVGLVCWAMWLGLGLALFRLARRFGAFGKASFAATALFLFTPIVMAQATEPAQDLASTAFFVLALGHLVQFWRAPRWDALVMFSLASGLFLGVKYSGPAYVLLLVAGLLIALWQLRHKLLARTLFGYGLAYVLGVALLGGYWYVQNLIQTGNPIYPIRISFVGHVIFPGAFDSAHYFNRLLPSLGKIAPADLLKAAFAGVGFPFVFVLALSALWLLKHLLKHLRGTGGPNTALWVMLLLTLAGSLLLYLNTPYSIMQLSLEDVIKVQNLAVGMRLGMIAFALCAIVIARAFSLSPRFLRALWLVLGPFIAYTLLASYQEPVLWKELVSEQQALAAGAIVTVGVFVCYAPGLHRPLLNFLRHPPRYGLAFLALIIVLAAGGGFYETKQFRERYRYDVYQLVYGDVAAGWRWIAQNVQGARVAFTSTSLSYPLYGPELRNRVRYVNIVGALGDGYHDFDRAAYRSGGDYDTWLRNLEHWGAEYLVAEDGLETDWARAHPETFYPVFDNRESHVFHIQYGTR